MQFRISRSDGLQCIRSIYDTEKKRCVQRVIKSANIYDVLSKWDAKREQVLRDFGVAEPGGDALTQEELAALAGWLDSRREEERRAWRRCTIRGLAASLRSMTDALVSANKAGELSADVLSEEDARQAWEAWKDLAAALKKSGHPRPRQTPRKPARTAPDGQGDLLADRS